MLPSVVLAGLVLTAGLSGMFGLRGALALATMSVLWLLVNAPTEGPLLFAVTDGHGLTGADLAGLTGIALAGFRALVLVRRSSGRPTG